MLKSTLLAVLMLGTAATSNAPPLCHVTATGLPAPGLDAPLVGLAFRFIYVTAGLNCAPARIALSNYGGRAQGTPLLIHPGERLRFGPVPLYRKLSWLAASGAAYDVPILQPTRGAP